MRAWHGGDLDGLVREGRAIQQHLKRRSSTQGAMQVVQIATKFSNLMSQGKTKAALRLLSSEEQNGVLPLHSKVDPSDPSSPSVLDALRAKHPAAQACEADALLDSDEVDRIETHPVIFDGLTANLIRRTALRTYGSAGPSGLDSSGWQRICTAFRKASVDLCLSMAQFARRIFRENLSLVG